MARAHQPHVDGGVEGGAGRRGGARASRCSSSARGARIRRRRSTPATPPSSPAARRRRTWRRCARCGMPISGTMDHFFVQATEQIGMRWPDSERAAFAQLRARVSRRARSCSSTPTTPSAASATRSRPPAGKLTGVRLDSNVTPETVARARQLLDELGAPHAKIFVSDGLDEFRVRELATAPTASASARTSPARPTPPTGIGAVAKLTVNGYGKLTMKLARGTGKATLPGELQVLSLRRPRSGRARRRGGRRRADAAACSRCGAGARRWRRRRRRRRAPTRGRRSRRCRRRLRALETGGATPWPLVASDGARGQGRAADEGVRVT